MDIQEIFDKVSAHMLKQNKRSVAVDNLACLYRGPEGLQCAVGCLIPDEEYEPSFEARGPVFRQLRMAREGVIHQERNMDKALKAAGIDTDSLQIRQLLQTLQQIHDGRQPEDWKLRLSKLASEEGLTFKEAA